MAVQAPPDLESQYRSMREGAGVIDRSERGKRDLVGPDAVDYLQGQVTNDIAALEPGRGCYAVLLSPKARILADLRVLMRSADTLWLDTEALALGALRSKLEMYRIGRTVDVMDKTEARGLVSLVGPRSRSLAGIEPPEEEHAFAEGEVEGVAVLAVATPGGLDLIVDAAGVAEVLDVLGSRGATPVGEQALEIVRIESGRPRYGRDMSDENLPAEVGLEERAVSFTKGCYVGQEPVARMHYRGHPNRHLRGLRLSEPAAAGETLEAAGRDVGAVTSAGVSPEHGPIALALVRREVEPGSTVGVGEAGRPAQVVELPFGQG